MLCLFLNLIVCQFCVVHTTYISFHWALKVIKQNYIYKWKFSVEFLEDSTQMNAIPNSSLLFKLIEWKKHQAALLFAVWDAQDEGRIAMTHLRPLLRSLFPPPMSNPSPGQRQDTNERLRERYNTALSVFRVRHAFHSANRDSRPRISAISRSCNEPTLTLLEVHRTIDYLCRYDFIQLREAAALAHVDAIAVNADSLSETQLFGCDEEEILPEPPEDIPLHDCDAFVLLLGDLERVFGECVAVSAPQTTAGSTASLGVGPRQMQRVAEEVLGKTVSYHEASAISDFFCSAFSASSSSSPRYIHKTHFLAAVLGDD